MKAEKELIWMFKLAVSKYCGGFLKKPEAGCKKDFEILLDAPRNDKDFLNWLDQLIIESSLEYVGNVKRDMGGRPTKSYVVNFKKLLERMRRNEHYYMVCNYFEAMSPLGISK